MEDGPLTAAELVDFEDTSGAACAAVPVGGYRNLSWITIDITAHADFVYIAAEDFMSGEHVFVVFDGTDPMNLMPVAEVPLPGDSLRYETVIEGDIAYVLSQPQGSGDHRIDLIDVADPPNAVWLGAVETQDRPRQLAAIDGWAYAAGFGTLTIFDVTDPATPMIVATPDIAAHGVATLDDRLYTTDGEGGVFTWDITDPADPLMVASSVSGEPWYRLLESTDGLVCAESGYSGRRDLERLEPEGDGWMPGATFEGDVVASMLFVSVDDGPVAVGGMELTEEHSVVGLDPVTLESVASWQGNVWAADMDVDGDVVWMTGGHDTAPFVGLLALRLDCG